MSKIPIFVHRPYGLEFEVSFEALANPHPLRGRPSFWCWLVGHKPEPIPIGWERVLPAGFVLCARCDYSSHAGGAVRLLLRQAQLRLDERIERAWREVHNVEVPDERV